MPTRRRSWARTWLFAVGVTLIAVVAVWTISLGVRGADDARKAQILFAQLDADMKALNGLDWEARAEGEVELELFDEYAVLRRSAAARFTALDRVDADDESPAMIRSRFNSYANAIATQLDLLRSGRMAEAERVDETLTDPAFDALKRSLARVIDEEDDEAQAAARMGFIATGGTVSLAALALVLLFWRFNLMTRRDERERSQVLGHQASHDALTGLGNRRKLMGDLERRLRVSDQTAFLAMFDLDGFKAYNDTFGHPDGDVLLQRLGRRLAEAVGPFGHAYRLGGDEFCVRFDTGVIFDQAVRRCVQALTDEGEGFHVGTSHGSVMIPSEASDPVSALRIADQRMYAQKGGRRASTRQQTRDLVLRVLAEQRPDLHDHARGVADLARAVGARLGLGDAELGDVVRAAELHDVGKIAIPDAIVHKPGPLDDDEWAFMRRHTIIGESMLSAAPALASVGPVVRSSHERFDGGGYPDGLAGEEIPLASRIVFVCDSFDAMTSDRPYQRGLTDELALAELRRCAGTQFDPRVVDAVSAELLAARRERAVASAPRALTV